MCVRERERERGEKVTVVVDVTHSHLPSSIFDLAIMMFMKKKMSEFLREREKRINDAFFLCHFTFLS